MSCQYGCKVWCYVYVVCVWMCVCVSVSECTNQETEIAFQFAIQKFKD